MTFFDCKDLDKLYMAEQLRRHPMPATTAIGVDEISIHKGHAYRVVVSDLILQRPIWFGGSGRKQTDLEQFFAAYGTRHCKGIQVAVMDMWRPFREATRTHAPNAEIVFDKFHILRHLNDALDAVRLSEYARVQGDQRCFIKGSRYTLLSHRDNLDLDGRKALKTLLAANQRLNTAYCSRSPSANSGTTNAKAGRDASSTTGRAACAGSGLRPSRSSRP